MLTFSSRRAARRHLADKGMILGGTSPFSDQDREYWKFADRPNALADHSATITRGGSREFFVSDFSNTL